MSKLKLQQPPGFYLIAWGELCERFSYYGAQTLLVLYITSVFSLSDKKAYALYGTYAAFAYALPVVGGLVADYLLELKHAIIIGNLLLIIGNLLMAVPHLSYFYAGLAFTVCGIGLYKPSSTTLVGKLYKTYDAQQKSGFTLFYLGINIGATVSPFVYGFVGKWGYHYSYLISAALLFINGIYFLIYNHRILLQNSVARVQRYWLAYSLILLISVAIIALFFYPDLSRNFLLIFAVCALGGLGMAIFRYEKRERNYLWALLILFFFGMCFFAASLQVGSSINLFIQRDVNRILFGWQIPTLMFTSLYPLAVLVTAPFMIAVWSYLAGRNKEPSVPTKVGLSLVFVSVAFICFTFAASNTNYYFPLIWILLGNLALGMGEICLIPTLLAAISQFAPGNLKSTLMGIWFLFIAFGGYLSSWIANLSSHPTWISKTISSTIYSHAFLKTTIITFLIACFMFVITPRIKSLITTEGRN
jgi:POT family proton-dependent oligopeptide transporter